MIYYQVHYFVQISSENPFANSQFLVNCCRVLRYGDILALASRRLRRLRNYCHRRGVYMQSQQERRLPVHGRRVEREDHRGADGKQLGREERRCGTLVAWRIV